MGIRKYIQDFVGKIQAVLGKHGNRKCELILKKRKRVGFNWLGIGTICGLR
jgi:hypothetical protein